MFGAKTFNISRLSFCQDQLFLYYFFILGFMLSSVIGIFGSFLYLIYFHSTLSFLFCFLSDFFHCAVIKARFLPKEKHFKSKPDEREHVHLCVRCLQISVDMATKSNSFQLLHLFFAMQLERKCADNLSVAFTLGHPSSVEGPAVMACLVQWHISACFWCSPPPL